MTDITTRVGENLNTILCLSLNDKYEYSEFLHTTQIDVLPETGIKGRGLVLCDGRVLEYQAALALKADNDYERMERLTEHAAFLRENWTGKCARPVPEIPEKPVWSEFSKLEDFEKLLGSPDYVPVGYDQANAQVYGVGLKDFYCYLICGSQRSGKTNFMKVFIQSAIMKESKVMIIDGPDHTLKAYKEEPFVTYAEDEDSVFALFAGLLPVFKERNKIKNDMLAQDCEEEEIYSRMSQETPYFIFISSLDWFVPFIYNAQNNMRGFLENILEKGKLHNIYFISELSLEKRAALTGYRIYDLFASYRTGIHFGGKVADNQIMSFDYMQYRDQLKADKPGIGRLPDRSDEKETCTIVVPMARR